MTRTSIKSVVFGVFLLVAAGRASAESRVSSVSPSPAVATVAQAGQAQQALSDCLVDSVTNAEKRVLVQWIFAIVARHPDVKPLADIDPAEEEKINRTASAVMETLIADRCITQVREVMRGNGASAIGKSFEVLGETAMEALLQNPDVSAGAAGLLKYADMARIERAILEK